MSFPNQIVLNRESASDAGDTRYRDFLIEQRQCDHIQSIDAAYQEGYNALRTNIEADEGAFSDRLSDAQSAYFAYRRVMLLRKLSNLVAKKAAPGVYPPNRFLLPSCGGLSANLSQSAVIDNDMDKQQEHQKLSYASWRRVLMTNRFEKRRGAFEVEYTRRLAADAMLRAEVSEKLARADDALLNEERQLMAVGLTPRAIDYLKRCGNQVWGVVMSMAIRNALFDPSLQGSLEALGLSTTASNSHVFSSLRYSTSSDPVSTDAPMALQDRRRNTNLSQKAMFTGGYEATHIPSNPFIDVTKPRADFIRTLFGNDSTALLAGHTVTCASFMPIDSSFVALGTLGGAVLLVHVSTGKIWKVLTGHYDKVATIKWAIEEDATIFLTSASADKTIRVWLVDRPVVVDLSSYLPKGTARDGADSDENKASSVHARGQSKGSGQKGGKALSKEDELKKAREETIEALQRAREEREFGRVRLIGGSAECVQIITTEYPILDIAFSPMSSSVIFASSVEAKDYPVLLEEEQESRLRRQQEFEMQSRVHRRRSSISGYPSAMSRGRRGMHSSSVGRYSIDGNRGRKSSSVPPSSGSSDSTNARSLWDRGVRGALGGLKTTAKAATKIVTLGGTISVPASGRLLRGQDLSIRGYLCAYNVTDGTLIQRRRIQSTNVDPTMLQKSSSYITSMCFDLSGKYIYAADKKGHIHAYEVATDESSLLEQPFVGHSVLYSSETLLSNTWKNMEDWRGKLVSTLEGKHEKETRDLSDATNGVPALGSPFDTAKSADSHGIALHGGGSDSTAQSKAHLSTSSKDNKSTGSADSLSSLSQNPNIYFTRLSIQYHDASRVTYLHALNSNNAINTFVIEFTGTSTRPSVSAGQSDYNALRSSGNFVDISAYRSTLANQVHVLPGVSLEHPKIQASGTAMGNGIVEEETGGKKRVGLLKRFERKKLMGQVASLATDVVRVGVNLGTAGIVSVNSTPIVLKPVPNLIHYPKSNWQSYPLSDIRHPVQSKSASKRTNNTPLFNPNSASRTTSTSYPSLSPREDATRERLLRGNHIGLSVLPNSNSLIVATNSSAYLISPFRDYLHEGGGLVPPSTVLYRYDQMQNDGATASKDTESPPTLRTNETFTPEKRSLSANSSRSRSTESPLRRVLFQSPNFSLRSRRASLASPTVPTKSPSEQPSSASGEPTPPVTDTHIEVLSASAAAQAARKASDGSGVEGSQVFAKFEAPMGLMSFVTTSFDGKYVLLSDIDGHITVWALKQVPGPDEDALNASQDQHTKLSSTKTGYPSVPNAPHFSAEEKLLTSNISSPYVKSHPYSRTRAN